MIRRSNRSVSILGLAAGGLAAIVPAGGIWMLGSLNTAFKQLQRIHSIRIEAQGALALQADAVAGLAEFSATGNSAFDRSYLGESALSEGRLARLAPQLICCGQSAETALADARKKESIWKERVAGAIVAHPRDVLPAFDGTILMDQFRSDLYQPR